MITISTTIDNAQEVNDAISSVDRLNELVSISLKADEKEPDTKLIFVDESFISIPIDWLDTEPPYVFPKLELTKENLLAIVFYKLGNHQKAFQFVKEDNPLYHDLLNATHLQFNYEISEDMFQKTRLLHNRCIMMHYGVTSGSLDSSALEEQYTKAISEETDNNLKVFTAKHFTNFLLDKGDYEKAERLLRRLKADHISEEAKVSIQVLLATALKAQLKLPHDPEKLREIKALFDSGIAFYESNNQKANAGLLYIETSEIANFLKDYITSKDLINKAILYFKEEDIPEFLGEAGLRKATLLYTWSKNGSPQYYKPAINAYQDVLKVFKKETYPQQFADVHHQLALIYSEIPVSPEEKPIWTAFCASSFKKVLEYYTQNEYPYEYAMVCHNYATALMGFPEAKMHDNLDKANQLFEEALAIRTSKKYPLERALTLINQLELYWLMHNEDSNEELEKYNEMVNKANEIKTLVDEETLIEKANKQLDALSKLKTILN